MGRTCRTYCVELGDSTRGAVGCVLEVEAASRREAVDLAVGLAVAVADQPVIFRGEGGGEARFYLNAASVRRACVKRGQLWAW